jgi:hypothetical protein
MTNALVQRIFDVDLWLAGAGHFVILLASFQVPYRLDWKHDLQSLKPFQEEAALGAGWIYCVNDHRFWHTNARIA